MMELKTNNTLQPNSSLTLVLLTTFALFFLTSCATLKKGDCVEGNWSGIGYNDASAGLKAKSQFSAHTKACSKFKITPNVAVYNAGYKKGLAKFCTTSSGYHYGAKKSEYYGVCPKTSQKQFLKGYLAGLDTAIIELNEEIRDLRFKRLRAISKHRRVRHHSDPDVKKINKWAKRIDSLESRIDSRRSGRRQLRRWHDYWATKLK